MYRFREIKLQVVQLTFKSIGPNAFDDIGGEYVNKITTLLKTKINLSIEDAYNYLKSGITKFEEEECEIIQLFIVFLSCLLIFTFLYYN